MSSDPEHGTEVPLADEADRVDERDTMFARMARRPGTWQYADTYQRRPELQVVDDRVRAMPPLCSPGGRHYDTEVSGEADRWFASIDTIEPDPRAVEAWSERLAHSSNPSTVLKEMSGALGAVGAGCCRVDEAYVYTHKGRLDEDYGRTIEAPLPHAVVFLVEMDHAAMSQAPQAPTIRESARQYYRAAVIARTLAATLQRAGQAATPHYDAHYEVILPPLAVAAGLGELGRNNILVADHLGSRVRIGAVTTDLPLRHDTPVELGIRHFCSVCRKCARACPSGALSLGEPQSTAGSAKWSTRREACYAFWRTVGTDCGICMAVCPFSHRDTWPHALVRTAVRRWPALHRLLVLGDDLLYGREWRPRPLSPPAPKVAQPPSTHPEPGPR